jgi:hypothetical protein
MIRTFQLTKPRLLNKKKNRGYREQRLLIYEQRIQKRKEAE